MSAFLVVSSCVRTVLPGHGNEKVLVILMCMWYNNNVMVNVDFFIHYQQIIKVQV